MELVPGPAVLIIRGAEAVSKLDGVSRQEADLIKLSGHASAIAVDPIGAATLYAWRLARNVLK